MNISIDYDATYTADRELWDTFIKSAQSRGHTVICVTKRGPSNGGQGTADITDKDVVVIYTDRAAKKAFVEAMGIRIDIWIDDWPLSLFEDG